MKAVIEWLSCSIGTTEHRVYRGTAPLDTQALPAPLATVSADVESYTDDTVVSGTTYYYIIGTVVDGVEYYTDNIVIEVSPNYQRTSGIWVWIEAHESSTDEPRPGTVLTDTSDPFWPVNYEYTGDFAIYHRARSSSNPDTGAQTGTINLFDPTAIFEIGTSGTPSYAQLDVDMEFRDATDAVVCALRVRRVTSPDYGYQLSYGPDLNNLTNAPLVRTGDFYINGFLKFLPDRLIFLPDLARRDVDYVDAFEFLCNMASVTKIHFPLLRAYQSVSGTPVRFYLNQIGSQAFRNFSASLDVNDNVELTWDETTPHIDQLNLYRGQNPIDASALPAPYATPAVGTETYTDTSLTGEETLYYMLEAIRNGQSQFHKNISIVVGGTPTNGLVTRYTMEDVAGSTIIDSVGTNDATMYLNTSIVAGRGGNVLRIAGSSFSDYSRVDCGAILPSTTDFTLLFWAETSTLVFGDDNPCFVTTDEDAAADALLFYARTSFGSANNQIRVLAKSTEVVIGPDIYNTGWRHLALSRSGDVYTLFIDGVAYGSGSVSGSLLGNLIIGNWASIQNRPLNGDIDEFFLYNRALSGQEVAQVMNLT